MMKKFGKKINIYSILKNENNPPSDIIKNNNINWKTKELFLAIKKYFSNKYKKIGRKSQKFLSIIVWSIW